MIGYYFKVIGMGFCIIEGKGLRMERKREFEIRLDFMNIGRGFLKIGGMIKGIYIKYLFLLRDLKRSEIINIEIR